MEENQRNDYDDKTSFSFIIHTMFHFGAGGGVSACSFGKVCGEAGP